MELKSPSSLFWRFYIYVVISATFFYLGTEPVVDTRESMSSTREDTGENTDLQIPNNSGSSMMYNIKCNEKSIENFVHLWMIDGCLYGIVSYEKLSESYIRIVMTRAVILLSWKYN